MLWRVYPITWVEGLRCHQITTGIGRRRAPTVTRRTRWGMTTIRRGSTPLCRLPSSAAPAAAIAQAASSCCKSFTATSGHRRRSTLSTSRRSSPGRRSSTVSCGRRPSAQQISPCAIDSDVEPVRSWTSLKPRRSRRAVSSKPAGDSAGMLARLDVVAHDHWWSETAGDSVQTPGTASTARISCE